MSELAERAAERIVMEGQLSLDAKSEIAAIIRAEYSEYEAAGVQARDRQWCLELAKHEVAARATYPGGIEVEVPTMAEAVEAAKEECARHVPKIKTDPTEAWLVCECGWQSGEGRTWLEQWTNHIRTLNTTGALDRKVNKARLEEHRAVCIACDLEDLTRHNPRTCHGGGPSEPCKRRAELKAALEKP